MAGSALTAVQSQQTLLTGYATAAQATATAALSSLAGIEMPYGSLVVPGYTPMSSHTPSDATRPGAMSVEGAPDIVDIEIPEAPDSPDTPKIDMTSISLEDLLEITLPDLPVIDIQPLDIDAPEYEIPDPLPWSFSVGDVLISDDPLMQAAITRLKNNIENGGTGLSADVEDAIWNRDLERMEQQLEDSTDKAISMWAKKGFSLPDGLLAHSLSELQKEYMNKSIDRSREIAVKQADLEQTNLFKSLEIAYNLASKLIENLIRYEELVFRGQEATARFANEYIDIQIKTYASLVEIYKARVQAYEISIRSELAKVEVYRAQIEAQRLIGMVNEQTLKVYSETIAAVRIIIDKYRAEVEAYGAALGAERTKIEANKLQMDAWAEIARVEIARYNGETEMYRAQSQFNVASTELATKVEEANLRAMIANGEAWIKAFESLDRTNSLSAQTRMEAAKGVASAAASLAAGAMAAVHAQASMSYSESMDVTP